MRPDVTPLITDFLQRIGIPIRAEPVADDAFLPGVTLRGGAIVYDPEKLLYPGDLLHEAGHIAVTEPGRRAALDGDAEDDPAEEMAAIAWSWAAAKAIGIDPRLVFHAHGYKGGGEAIFAAFDSGRAFGVPLLAWYGMTSEAEFPRMERWLR
jgi:hypothetical protein